MAQCQVCHQCLATDKILQRHMHTVHGQSLYQCAACTKTFNRKDNFERHKRLMHKSHIRLGIPIGHVQYPEEASRFSRDFAGASHFS